MKVNDSKSFEKYFEMKSYLGKFGYSQLEKCSYNIYKKNTLKNQKCKNVQKYKNFGRIST